MCAAPPSGVYAYVCGDVSTLDTFANCVQCTHTGGMVARRLTAPQARDLTPEQLTFRSEYLEHGDPYRAYKAAYAREPSRGLVSGILRCGWMEDILNARRVVDTVSIQLVEDRAREAAAAIASRPIRSLECHAGYQEWLMDIMEGKAEIRKMISVPVKQGDGSEVLEEREVVISPTFTERIQAAKLLGMSSAYLTAKVEQTTVTEDRKTVFVHLDNGRGPTAGRTVEIKADAIATCSKCEAVYAAEETHVCSKKSLTP